MTRPPAAARQTDPRGWRILVTVLSPVSALASSSTRAHVSLRWLIAVRWGAAVGQVVVILWARFVLGLLLPLPSLFALSGIVALTNIVAARWPARRESAPPRVVGTLLAIDTLLLTAALALTGGPLNPFSFVYLVYITLAAVVLSAPWTWFLTVLAACGYGLLFFGAQGTVPHSADHAPMDMSSHLQGMWWAFVLSASLTAYFVVKLSSALEHRDRELAGMREQAARHERLASLTTLAAGAAHELSTPLGTIAVVTREMERALERLPPDAGAGLLADAHLIRDELQRCRAILDRMAAQAGEPTGEMPSAVSVRDLVSEALRALPADEASRVTVQASETIALLTVPGRGLVTALVSLLRNALDASDRAQPVTLAASADGDIVRLTIRDSGIGMTPDVLSRVGEPFFSTKPAGAGMGLGVFLTRALAERLGGVLRLESTPGAGTSAILELPASLSTARALSEPSSTHAAV
jgi:two-component system sensor histidine kinase RegB